MSTIDIVAYTAAVHGCTEDMVQNIFDTVMQCYVTNLKTSGQAEIGEWAHLTSSTRSARPRYKRYQSYDGGRTLVQKVMRARTEKLRHKIRLKSKGAARFRAIERETCSSD